MIDVESDKRDKREKDDDIKFLWKRLSLKAKMSIT